MSKTKFSLNGYKTYIVGGLVVVTGIAGYVTGVIDKLKAWELVLSGLGIIGFRDALKKLE